MKNLHPIEAWTRLQAHPDTRFVDVRMEIESRYMKRPPAVVNMPRCDCPALQVDALRLADRLVRKVTDRPAKKCNKYALSP